MPRLDGSSASSATREGAIPVNRKNLLLVSIIVFFIAASLVFFLYTSSNQGAPIPIEEKARQSMERGEASAKPEKPRLVRNCTYCHTSRNIVRPAYLIDLAAISRSVHSSLSCTQCHETPFSTGNYSIVHSGMRTKDCGECHPVNETHASQACVSCHSLDGRDPHLIARAEENCDRCHPELVFEGSAISAHDGAGLRCSACHGSLHHSRSSSLVSCDSCHEVALNGSHGRLPCTVCHLPATIHSQNISTVLCTDCHGAPEYHAAKVNCTQCHGAQHDPKLAECTKCHDVVVDERHSSLECTFCHQRIHSREVSVPLCSYCHGIANVTGRVHQVR